ncbi:hypothetical protein AWB85_25005 [Mycobacteroides immunogenum]|uniref:RecF/RecN/SMC N-terminal domain-containing protein n=2 Tax=Mycobacteroides TaxID=670516 RepID=A0A179V9N0_9MYCO|nr:hypothetical protein [Mycobacteroides immunogenum]OAT68434.1 hypothetical protein AWB85_25005 [Mycobacteroides immunogenum]
MTKTSREENSTATEVSSAEDGFRRHFDLVSLLEAEVLGAVNRHRGILGLDLLESLAPDTDLSAGAAAPGEQSHFNKASAVQDIKALSDFVQNHDELAAAADELSSALAELEANLSILDALKHRALMETGLPLITDATCPLCDLQWDDMATLRAHLQSKLERSEAAAALQRRVQQAATRARNQVQRARGLVQASQPHAVTVERSNDQAILVDWIADLAAFEANMATFETIREQAGRVRSDPLALPATLGQILTDIAQALDALPDPSATANARDALTIAQERWGRLRQARAERAKAVAAHNTAKAVYETYNNVADTALTTLYKTVEDDFSDYYRRINADDESSFKAGLAPSAGKLDLEVDFYGLGMFPPTAYHSEGHQDGMGVCLYLALIGQLLQDNFRFAVLDDVVTSVDTNHRRQFCGLLNDVFPDVQFIITTHDEVWARQMQSSGLISRQSKAQFHGWNVERGPMYGQGQDFWEQIEADLANNDVPGAAHKLRRNLEALIADIAAPLQAKVIYRADNNYELGAFLDGVKGRYRDLLKKAKDSANSWNNDAVKRQVAELDAVRVQVVGAQDGENWAINALVHNNDWAAMSKADFAPVVTTFKEFLGLFTCSNVGCDGWIYVVGTPGGEEALRCGCGALNLNLRGK